jgi:hypothetical protein
MSMRLDARLLACSAVALWASWPSDASASATVSD